MTLFDMIKNNIMTTRQIVDLRDSLLHTVGNIQLSIGCFGFGLVWFGLVWFG
jgi:hypothetical protein